MFACAGLTYVPNKDTEKKRNRIEKQKNNKLILVDRKSKGGHPYSCWRLKM